MKPSQVSTDQTIFNLEGRFTARYTMRKGTGTPQEPVIILLHGYSQSGDHFFNKVQGAIPQEVTLVSPNGPFPVPQPVGKEYRLGFSWYFFESKTDEYYVDMQLAASYLQNLMRHLKLEENPKILIGYSQGGYVAPVAAQSLKHIKRIIGVNCQFLEDEISWEATYPFDQVQSLNDEIVDPEKARASFEKLRPRNPNGDFIGVPGAGHGISEAVFNEVKKRVQTALLKID